MQEIVIIGAGAIGRGYLPWVLDRDKYELIFVDSNKKLVDSLNNRKRFKSYMSRNNSLEEISVNVKSAHHIDEFELSKCTNPATIFVSVGPRNCIAVAKKLIGVSCPIILAENDEKTVEQVKNALSYEKVYFAVPDVITSNTASSANLLSDPLAVHTEEGVLHIDERAERLIGKINYCSEARLNQEWIAKLYLHNTPHCIAAYLGSLLGCTYLHETMKYPDAYSIVEGAMNEMLIALKLEWDIPHDYLEWYAAKELSRFSNTHLCDPISRVAREPLRKLELRGRLMGAAQMCLSHGFIPTNIIKGIVSALLFENTEDPDHHISFLRKSLEPSQLTKYILGLRRGEVLDTVIQNNFNRTTDELESLVKKLRGANV
jgi:mannitol-1-phosphate/altronate dehydrogenase